MKLAPHLHRLGNDIVACYLVSLPEGITLIDAGLPGHWSDLLRELEAIGRPLSDIRGLVLTHGDTDHFGFAERLRSGEKPETPMGLDHFRAGRLWPMLGFFTYGLRKNGLRSRVVQQVREVSDGDEIDLPGSPAIIAVPGHSPGSVAVHVPAVDAVFVGDALTTRHVLAGIQGPQPAPFTSDPDTAKASLGRLKGVSASWVLPGHGGPWRGDPADIAAAVQSQ
ncbi:MAG: MBL fold metallo-hydrolase [Brevibacterium linens]|uniref:MBL fold metallo-hydrolase n=1 Tax=Brevibacterium linens TaxID=1703 RepID=UPI000FCC8EEC|nr:MBL fold metallo-hydrolase [Brevibacterium linens]AZU02158.1 MBL fold metallo-hydrolase [Brevibacterium linens]